jgi:hypothetical protein
MRTRKRYERNANKNPWTTTNPNYKFGDIILSDDALNVAAPCTKTKDNSKIIVALRSGRSWWPKREKSSSGLEQIPMQLGDWYDLFNDALDVTLIYCFILLVT